MDECLILVDNSNVFIEGKKLSARRKGLFKEVDGYEDSLWRIDFGSLLKEIANGHKIIKAILIGSTPPPNDSLWDAAKTGGFEVKTFERSHITGGEKAVDMEIGMSGARVIFRHPNKAILKLVSDDSDFIPLVKLAYEEEWEVELWGFQGSLSAELSYMATRVKLLDDVFDRIGK
jgi:uncharacterized LabA/DUF88 family protein